MSIKAIRHLFFIDSSVSDYESLVDQLASDCAWIVLNSSTDGIEQMAKAAAGFGNLDSIQIISHGSVGSLTLGGTTLNNQNLSTYGTQLHAVGNALSDSGDILLYGCNVAQGDAGNRFVEALAQATGADVAASDDITSSNQFGGNLVLEKSSGQIETQVAALQGMQDLAVNTAPTFSVSDGKVVTNLGGRDIGRGVIQQSDGKLVVAGGDGNFYIARYTVDGSLDTTFNNTGYQSTDIGLLSNDSGYSLIQQANGKFVVAGNSNENIALVRYSNDGTLDSTFGDGGKLVTNIENNATVAANCIIQQADAKLLVAGYAYGYVSGNADFTLVRYESDGTLDNSFGIDGKLITDFGSLEYAWSVAQQIDGKIIVGGTHNGNGFALARYHLDGSLDETFGTGGKLITGYSSVENVSIAIQSDGKVLIAGSIYNFNNGGSDFAIARYTNDGQLDTTFNGDGKLEIDLGAYTNEKPYKIIQQADGNILVAGVSAGNFALVRYTANGTLDTTFDFDGKVLTDFDGEDIGYSVIQQTDGKIVVAGSSNEHFALARYNLDGSLDTTFSSSGNTLGNTLNYNEPSIYDSRTVRVLAEKAQIYDAELSASGSYNGSSVTLSRNGGANGQDIFGTEYYSDTISGLIEGSYFSVDNVTIGRVSTNSGGVLKLTFNNKATQSLVDKALQNIAYGNTSDAPPESVVINWVFDDGNTGSQGTDGAKSVVGQTTVNITATNDAPVSGYLIEDMTALPDTPFVYNLPTGAFSDPDLEPLTYSVRMQNGTATPPWLEINPLTGQLSGTPDASDAGVFELQIKAADSSGRAAYDYFMLTVPSADKIAPTVATFTPTDGATDVAVDSNIVLTFDEDIQKGTGSISLYSGTTFVESFDAATSTRLSISGNTLTLDPTANLSNNTEYRVNFDSGTVKDLAGNAYIGTSTYDFKTVADVADMIAPKVDSANPIDGAKDVLEYSSFAFTFNEEIAKGTGYIYIHKESPTGEIVESFNVATSSNIWLEQTYFGMGTYSTKVLNVNPTGNLLSATEYFLTIEAGALVDFGGNKSEEIHYEFTTRQAKVTNGTRGNDMITIARPNLISLGVFSENDLIYAGAGNDVVDSGGGIDLIDGGEGVDTVSFKSIWGGGYNYALYGVNVSLDLTESQIYQATGDAVTLINIENIVGSGLDDTLVGNDANNELDGYLGTDVLMGGLGNDIYIVDRIGDKVIEDENEGIDLVQASSTYTLGDNLENIQLTGTSNISAVGNSLNNLLIGNAGSNVLNGGAGIDTVSFINATKAVVANLATKKATGFGTDTLTNIENLIGSNFNDTLTGSTSANKLEGGSGNDSIDGAAGSDTVVYALARSNYTITYNSGTSVYTVKAKSGSEGTDTVKNVENFSFSDGVFAASSLIDATAPTVSTFSPTDGATGVAVGSNIVLTFSEAIQKGTGTIYLRSGSATGTIVEQFNAATSDRITISDRTLTLDPTVNLSGNTKYFITFASGTVKDLADNAYTGTSTYDFTTGSAPITGTAGNDTLSGTTAADVINGLDGNDTITGAGAVDTMDGQEGSDLYIIAATTDHSAAEIADSGASGTDEVRYTATSSSTLTLYAGDTGIETVVIGTGTAANAVTTAAKGININAAAVLNGLSITGNAGANSLTGTSYADNLIGNAGNDSLLGGAGNDTLNGGTGADSLTGGLGKDTFVFAAGSSGQATNFDIIADFAKGAVGAGDLIDHTSALTIGGSNAAATSTQAAINMTNGVATFAAGSGKTLSDALADIASRFTAATNSAGEFAFFRVNNTGDYYAFISDGTAGVTANDVVIQLTGISSIGSINLTDGDVSILS